MIIFVFTSFLISLSCFYSIIPNIFTYFYFLAQNQSKVEKTKFDYRNFKSNHQI